MEAKTAATGTKLVFVTGNQNKLKEVKAILGPLVENLENAAIDCECLNGIKSKKRELKGSHIVPELQGEAEDISRAKCKLAVEKVILLLQ